MPDPTAEAAPSISRRSFLTRSGVVAAAISIGGVTKASAQSASNTANVPERKLEMVYLQITLQIDQANRAAAAGIYQKYKAPFLDTVAGAKSKELLVRDEDVQVLHGFDTKENANAYLQSKLFTADVVEGLKPLLSAAPDVRIYQVA
ncbi:MAG: twin-arginine translocation signal domain-containing protein [Burkholderiales bacterium]|nr:twin-arginine translocation signal domain-containing protein [Burkholderiales bacterium]